MQVTKHVHALKIPFTLTIGPGIKLDRFVYVFLIYGKEICLIDTGVADSEQIIFEYVKSTGRRPDEISTIVQTHTHPDHIGATKAVKQACNSIVAVHKEERDWIEDVELQFRERPIPGFHTLVGGSVSVDRVLTDGDEIVLSDGLKLEVFHTPGHSKGSVSLLLNEDRVLFSGDAIPLAGDVPIYEDFGASIDSIEKLKSIGGINKLLASWDKPQDGPTAYALMNDSLIYLHRIHELVAKHAANDLMDPMELCKKVVEELGLPAAAATPHLAKSFAANRKALKE